MSERARRDILATVQREVKAARKAADDEFDAIPMGMERPVRPPFGGHRGPMYCGDLFNAIREAAYRPDVRAVYNQASNMTAMLDRSHLWTLYAGDPDPRKKQKPWIGAICNVRRGMVPEFTMMEHLGDPESEVHCHGWRTVLEKCLGQKVIKPSAKILSLLGPTDYYLSMK